MTGRRKFLALCAGGTLGVVAGCNRGQKSRELGFESFNLTQTGLFEYDIRTKPIVNGLGNKEYLTFNSVTLHVFNTQGTELAKKDLGTLSANESTEPVSFSVDGIPAVLTYKAKETLCEEGTSISIATWDRWRDGEYMYDSTKWRKCNEPFPPPFSINRNYGEPFHVIKLENKTAEVKDFSIEVWQAPYDHQPIANFDVSVSPSNQKEPLTLRTRGLYQILVSLEGYNSQIQTFYLPIDEYATDTMVSATTNQLSLETSPPYLPD